MKSVIKLFGTNGFDIPLALLIDLDAKTDTAKVLAVHEDDLEQSSVWISDPDLEAEYVAALGADRVWAALSASHLFNQNELKSAMVVATLLDETAARKISSIEKLLTATLDGA
jgi:putative ATP-dependent endonuclease of OLD family